MIQPIAGNAIPNPAQLQQAINPINEVGGNDLQSGPAQRVEAAAETQEAPPSPPPADSGRGQLVDISV